MTFWPTVWASVVGGVVVLALAGLAKLAWDRWGPKFQMRYVARGPGGAPVHRREMFKQCHIGVGASDLVVRLKPKESQDLAEVDFRFAQYRVPRNDPPDDVDPSLVKLVGIEDYDVPGLGVKTVPGNGAVKLIYPGGLVWRINRPKYFVLTVEVNAANWAGYLSFRHAERIHRLPIAVDRQLGASRPSFL